jgi:HTH-type transcriptional regulator / antitoxin HigA
MVRAKDSTMHAMRDVIKPIRSDEDLEDALEEIDRLWGAEAGSPEADRLDVLATLVEVYEDEHYQTPHEQRR